MKRIILEQIDWDAASKEASKPTTGTKTTVTKPKSDGGSDNKGGGSDIKSGGDTKNKDNITKGGGESAADKLKNPETRVVAEAETIQSYIRAAYVAFSKIGPMTTNMNLDEAAIHQALINYLGTGNASHITLKAQYLDFIIRISNPNSSLSSFIKQNFAAWNYVIKGKKGLTIQAIRAVPCLPSLRTFNDFINPESQLGNWLDAHDLSDQYVFKLIRILLTKANAITVTESNNVITRTKFIKSKSSTMWNKKVLTLYKSKAYG